MLSLTTSNPAQVRVLLEREDGSGVIEVPLLSVGALDFGDGEELDVTADMLAELAANFPDYPGPIPVGPSPHVDFNERSGPQPGFVESLEVRDGRLWGRIDLNADLFASVVRRREWRGFSVEMVKNLRLPARKFSGWVLVGGVFTNRPASDVVFKVAAESSVDEIGSIFSTLSGLERPSKEQSMSDEKVIGLAAHEAKVGELNAQLASATQESAALKSRITALEADLKAASERSAKAEAQASELANDKVVAQSKANTAEAQVKALSTEKRNLEAKVNELTARVNEIETAQLSENVKSAVLSALEAGVPPAIFDGYEADPANWMKANFASFESFENHVSRVRGVAKLGLKSDVRSGAENRKEVVNPSDQGGFTEDERRELERAGVKLDVDFTGVTNEEDARKRFEAFRASKK